MFKYLLGLLGVGALVMMWGVQATVALRNCYLDYVESQNANKYTGVLTSGLSTEKQMELNELVIDSYPECDQQIAQDYFLPEFGVSLIVQAAQ